MFYVKFITIIEITGILVVFNTPRVYIHNSRIIRVERVRVLCI